MTRVQARLAALSAGWRWRRCWGHPRLHVRGAVALWLLAVLLAAIAIWLVLD